jgi:hypothetical protein
MNEAAREQVPAKTTPTWEMELLVSGATIFGLLQLPELIDHGYFRTANLMPQAYAYLLQAIWMYSKIAVVTLALTFLAHLCLRGYWVALVGLDSVFPGGIRWERMDLGPIARDRFASQPPAQQIAEWIERADNRATRVFGTGVAFAMLMFAPLLLVSVALAGGLLAQALLGERYAFHGFVGAFALVLGPRILVSTADRRFPRQLEASPRLRRALGAVAAVYNRFGFGVGSNPLVALFASHAGRLRFVLSAVGLIVLVASAIILTSHGRGPFGAFAGIGARDPWSPTSSPAAFYGDQRDDPWTIAPLPYIPSRVAGGPYVELFVPFLPRLHGAALPVACPGLDAAAADNRARLDCLARIVAIRLDDAPIAVALDATTDPRTGQPGLLAMIPVAALAAGRHEISLNEPDRRALDGAPPRRYRIPFWK